MSELNGARIIPTEYQTITTKNIFLAPYMSASLPMTILITAPVIMYADRTHDAKTKSTLNDWMRSGSAGANAV